MLTLEELQDVFDEMRIGKVVNTMKKEDDASIEEQQEELKEAVLKDLDKKK